MKIGSEIFWEDFDALYGEIVDESSEKDFHKKFFSHAEFKAVDDEQRIIEGMASTKMEDRYEEVVAPKAFRSSLKEFKKWGKILLNHGGGWLASDARAKLPIGVPLDAKIVEEGLWLKARIGEGDIIEDVWSRIKQKLMNAFSIGFITKKAKWVTVKKEADDDEGRKIRMITDLELLEVSVVTIPANPGAVFSMSKGLALAAEMQPNGFTLAAEMQPNSITGAGGAIELVGGEPSTRATSEESDGEKMAEVLVGASRAVTDQLAVMRLNQINKKL